MKTLPKTFARFYAAQSLKYEIPEKYRSALFLANAALFDYTNWFIHRSYEICFSHLVNRLKGKHPNLDDAEAAKKVGNIINYLEPCNSLVDINFPVKKSDGLHAIIRGFRAYHCLHFADSPCLGGMRICADLSRDHVKAFSVLSTFKHACMGIPSTGAHGGLKISAPEYDGADLKTIIETYGKELAKRETHVDILEPDLYCGPQEISWISTGNIFAVGRSQGDFFALGVVFALKCFLGNKKVMQEIQLEGDLEHLSFIIQGFGKAGAQIASLLCKSGATCVGIKEHDGCIYMPEGIHLEEVLRHKDTTGSILEFNTKTKPTTSSQIFTNECDVLILAATHRSLQCHVAERIQAKVIVEAAYSAITPAAHRILVGRKRLVLPDIFAGAGASVASYFEFVINQNGGSARPMQIFVKPEDVGRVGETKVEDVMKKSYDDVVEILDKFKLGVDVRTGAYIKGIVNIFQKIYDKELC